MKQTMPNDHHKRFALTLAGLFAIVWIAFAIDPKYRSDWLLENILAFLLLPVLFLSYRKLPLSRLSYCCIFGFMCVHELGAHYTYSEVPYDVWAQNLFGQTISAQFDWQRNHFDRLVHFLYGLLLTYPAREVFLRLADARGFWGYLFPLLLVMSTSMIYELIEWAAAVTLGGDLGMAYLGTQGDIWDAHKDMWLATFGSICATLIIAVVHRSLDRDFAREWSESLRVKQAEPLGETAIAELLEKRD
jgi:putative membrane protein